LDGDADGDVDVDGRDFLVWQGNHTGNPALVSVPEPPTIAALLFLFSALLTYRSLNHVSRAEFAPR